MRERRFLSEIDWGLLGLLILNSAVGVLMIASASPAKAYVFKQLIWILISLSFLFLFLAVDYRRLTFFSPYFYIFFSAILMAMLFFGQSVGGTKSWIRFSFFQIQPSELMKIVLILFLAHIFSGFKSSYLSFRITLLSIGTVFLPMALVALQPDLGTSSTYIPILLSCFVLAGLKKKTVIILLILAVVAGAFSWNFILKDYQKKRIVTFLSPQSDPKGSGYHINQSKIAIGSGGFFGKGYKRGTQSSLRFLPARHTDFIFAVLGEEFGFVGVGLVLTFYFLFLQRLFHSVLRANDRTGVYVVFMVACFISYQFFVNVMMIIGLFPITGVPLPLLSYGGSSLLSTYLAVSLALNVKMRRFVYI